MNKNQKPAGKPAPTSKPSAPAGGKKK